MQSRNMTGFELIVALTDICQIIVFSSFLKYRNWSFMQFGALGAHHMFYNNTAQGGIARPEGASHTPYNFRLFTLPFKFYVAWHDFKSFLLGILVYLCCNSLTITQFVLKKTSNSIQCQTRNNENLT